MATVGGRGGQDRRGLGISIYISNAAEDLLERVSMSTRRSKSEIISLLVETYGPQLLADSEGRPKT